MGDGALSSIGGARSSEAAAEFCIISMRWRFRGVTAFAAAADFGVVVVAAGGSLVSIESGVMRLWVAAAFSTVYLSTQAAAEPIMLLWPARVWPWVGGFGRGFLLPF